MDLPDLLFIKLSQIPLLYPPGHASHCWQKHMRQLPTLMTRPNSRKSFSVATAISFLSGCFAVPAAVLIRMRLSHQLVISMLSALIAPSSPGFRPVPTLVRLVRRASQGPPHRAQVPWCVWQYLATPPRFLQPLPTPPMCLSKCYRASFPRLCVGGSSSVARMLIREMIMRALKYAQSILNRFTHSRHHLTPFNPPQEVDGLVDSGQQRSTLS
jgi:hypothetical protein